MTWEYNDREYCKNPRGHEWERDETGDVEIFAYSSGNYHNGPRCVKCGYGFCHHCHDEPQQECSPDISQT